MFCNLSFPLRPVLTNALKSEHLSKVVAVSAVDKAADCPSRMQGRAGWTESTTTNPEVSTRNYRTSRLNSTTEKSGGVFSLANLSPFGSKVATE